MNNNSRSRGMDNDKEVRFFTIDSSSTGVTGGRYKGTRSQAANKAGSRLYSVAGGKTDDNSRRPASISFELRETTRGSDHKVSSYVAKYERLSCPRVQRFPDPNDPDKHTTVTYTHKVVVKAAA
jgi:hypothetical protein